MASRIVKLIPQHTVYVEPFAGGAAVLFRKPLPTTTNVNHYREVINDVDQDLVNFYRMMRERPDELIEACQLSLQSRADYAASRDTHNDDIERARRYFVNLSQSFANKRDDGWRVSRFGCNDALSFANRRKRLPQCVARFNAVYVECDDAVSVIKRWDSPHTFFYCDPPYPGTRQGHYSGYTLDDYAKLVAALDDCAGSFILSNYAQDIEPRDCERNDISARCSAANGKNKTANRKRTEVLWLRHAKVAPRKEIQALYDSGKFDCFAKSKPLT